MIQVAIQGGSGHVGRTLGPHERDLFLELLRIRFRVRSDITVIAMDEDTKDMNGRGAGVLSGTRGRKID